MDGGGTLGLPHLRPRLRLRTLPARRGDPRRARRARPRRSRGAGGGRSRLGSATDSPTTRSTDGWRKRGGPRSLGHRRTVGPLARSPDRSRRPAVRLGDRRRKVRLLGDGRRRAGPFGPKSPGAWRAPIPRCRSRADPRDPRPLRRRMAPRARVRGDLSVQPGLCDGPERRRRAAWQMRASYRDAAVSPPGPDDWTDGTGRRRAASRAAPGCSGGSATTGSSSRSCADGGR